MKLYPITYFILSLLVWSCSVIDTPMTEVDDIRITNDYPSSEIEAMGIFTTARGWKMTGFELESINGFQQCRMDDQIILSANGTYDFDGGETKPCGAEDDTRYKSGTWSFDHINKKVFVDEGTEESFSLDIESMSETMIIFSSSYMGLDILGRLEAL